MVLLIHCCFPRFLTTMTMILVRVQSSMPSSTKLTRLLVDVAMGRAHADLVIRNGQWVCVQSGEIIEQTDVAIVNGHIAYVGGNAGHTIGKDTVVVDAHGMYLVPGLLDGHMHVELGMVTVTEFVRAVAPRGTTGMFIDPHEIANVFGLKGVKLMVDEAAGNRSTSGCRCPPACRPRRVSRRRVPASQRRKWQRR